MLYPIDSSLRRFTTFYNSYLLLMSTYYLPNNKSRITGSAIIRAIPHDLLYSMIESRNNFYNKKGNSTKENNQYHQSPVLAQLQEGNRRIAAENSVILQRVKNKWKTNMELKKRLKQLQSLAGATKPAGANNEGRRQELRKHRSVGLEGRQQDEMQALEQRFNALVVENMEKKGFSRVKIRAEMSELAKRIRDMKSVKVSFKA